MGVVSSIIRSRDDLVKPKTKSYWGYKLSVRLVDKEDILGKSFLLPSDKKAKRHELSGIEPVRKLILLENSNKKLGRLTTSQIKEIFDDMGFNVDVLFSEKFYSDVDAVMNIGGSGIPGWVFIARRISKLFPSKEKLLLSKLSAGKDRLHLRIFESNDGSWVIIAHTDANWLSLNLARAYRAHLKEGMGDYLTGSIMVYGLLKEFSKSVSQNKVFRQKDIERVIKNSYKESLIAKIGRGTDKG